MVFVDRLKSPPVHKKCQNLITKSPSSVLNTFLPSQHFVLKRFIVIHRLFFISNVPVFYCPVTLPSISWKRRRMRCMNSFSSTKAGKASLATFLLFMLDQIHWKKEKGVLLLIAAALGKCSKRPARVSEMLSGSFNLPGTSY